MNCITENYTMSKKVTDNTSWLKPYMHYTLDQSHSEIIQRQLLENLEAEGKVVQMKFLALHNILLIKN